MKLELNRRSAFKLAKYAIGIRLIASVILDGTRQGADWLQVLMATLFSLPPLLLICFMQKKQPDAAPLALVDQAFGQFVRRAYCLILCLFALHEAACTTRILTLSAEFASFDKVPLYVLVCISIVVGCLSCMFGGIGLGGMVQAWFPVCVVILVLVAGNELFVLNPRWLTPILGPGLGQLAQGAVPVTGMCTALVSTWLCTAGESGQDQKGGRPYKPAGAFHVIRALLSVSVAVMLIVAALDMQVPVLPSAPNERGFMLRRLIANGLNATELQFPLMLLWLMSVIISLSFYIYSAACMLQFAAPRLRPRWCLLIVSAVAIPLTLSPLSNREYITVINTLRIPMVYVPLLFISIAYLVKQRGKQVAPQ